jgi:hypothetical protein
VTTGREFLFPAEPTGDRSSKARGRGLTLAAATPFFRTGAGAATLKQTPTTTDVSGTSLSISSGATSYRA